MGMLRAVEDDSGAGIVAAAAAGDVRALEVIIARHHADMARVCVLICGGDADLADDAVQIAWSIVWRKLGTLRDPGRLRPWLVSVAANEARALVRRRRHVVELTVIDGGSDVDDPGRDAAAFDLGVAVRQLGADDRTLLALRYVAGFDSTEIGRLMNLSASGVRSRLERLLARLRMDLGDE
jgi:RNA polymerase sigma factor (sigma-70 family)